MMKSPLIPVTALLVLLIASFAGGTLLLLRRMHNRAAHEAAAETVIRRGSDMVAQLAGQAGPESGAGTTDWERFSHIVRNLHAVEDGLQYVSVMRDGIVVFHEQMTSLDGPRRPPEHGDPPSPVLMRRELLQAGERLVPVVVFTSDTGEEGGIPAQVEVALRKDVVHREEHAAGEAIASMFRLTLMTVAAAFGLCMAMVVWMMRREVRHEALRTEQEHLAFSGMLANGIVHDFRNPMSSLKLDVQMLHRETEAGHPSRPERVAALADRIRGTLDRMDEVFKAFLYVSRPDRAERATVDATACARDAVAMLAPRFERAALRTVIEAPDEPLPIHVFVASVRRALVNVLTNAIQFSPTGPADVTLVLACAGNSVVMDISDQGPGIPEADRKRVFEMFHTTRPEGTGLGLFLARAAIERSGGTIAVAAPPPGGGTCIRIILPAA